MMVGFSLGIVVQNNDPQKRGRVKVFIPHLSLNIYEGWDNLSEEKTFEKLSDPKIKVVIDDIKNQLPWANCAAPIFGETGDHYYNAKSQESKSGDSIDKIGDKPAKSIEDSPPQDAFSNNYSHNSYNNSSKGLFSVPRVGSRVWVFFENNNLNRPVYFATSYGGGDWDKVSNEHYPDKSENFSKNDQLLAGDSYDDSYQNKVVVSQRGGVIEIVNSDNAESVQISHYNGGFKIWSNGGTKEYVEGDDKKLVKSNSQVNVKCNSQLHVGKNMDIHVIENQTITVGGDVNIDVAGSYTVKSGGPMKFEAPRIDLN